MSVSVWVLSWFKRVNPLNTMAPGVCRGGDSLSFRQTSWRDFWPEINLLFPLLGLIKYTQLVLKRAGPGSQSNASFSLSKGHIVLYMQDSGERSAYFYDMFLASPSPHFPTSLTPVITVPAWERQVSCFAPDSQWMPSNRHSTRLLQQWHIFGGSLVAK